MSNDYHLHDGKMGAALAIHVIPRAQHNEIVEIQRDGTIKVRLNAAPDGDEMNTVLISFLSQVLLVPERNIEVVAGASGRSKLVSVIDLNSQQAHDLIVKNLV